MTKILCVGDLHLGRVPRLPQNMCETGTLTPQMFSPVAAWQKIVEYACAAKPAAVVSVGDIIDKENRFYEAFGPFEKGLKDLENAGIPVYAVAGNHDGISLPRMTRSLSNFRLIGQGGKWEIVDLPDKTVRLLGWSFLGEAEKNNPLSSFDVVRDEIKNSPFPVIGLLHCDLDMAESRYAPVSSQQLKASHVHAWLLGHIHKPHPFVGNEKPLIGYLGSCVGLDPTETGIRGPWMLDISVGGAVSMTHLPLAPLHWENCDLSVEQLENVDELENLLISKAQDVLDAIQSGGSEAKAVGLRLNLVGRTRFRQDFLKKLPEAEALLIERESCIGFIDKADGAQLRPALDLAALRGNDTPLGLLASRLWEIDAQTEHGRRYVEEARLLLDTESKNRSWLPLEASPITEDDARGILLTSGLDALEALQAQKRAS